MGEIIVPYVVTARHCVEGVAGREFHIRVNVQDRYDDIPTSPDDWFKHDAADVAVIPWAGGPSPHYDLQAEVPLNFISADYDFPLSSVTTGPQPLGWQVLLTAGEVVAGKIQPQSNIKVEVGHEVCFVGLLYEQPGTRRNLPIARFGHVARMPEEPIAMKQPDGTRVPMTAFLVECDSWGGNSGSPCYWLHPMVEMAETSDPRPDHAGEVLQMPHERPLMVLLGLVSSHLDMEREALTEGDVLGKVRM
ncbi:MAG TPA: hypothetical protein VNH20_06275, partial [Candidatus Dormibacteraeota bacterium]|nr:hypothetical protein [Candidatus Dormibacteraeota bacterium]